MAGPHPIILRFQDLEELDSQKPYWRVVQGTTWQVCSLRTPKFPHCTWELRGQKLSALHSVGTPICLTYTPTSVLPSPVGAQAQKYEVFPESMYTFNFSLWAPAFPSQERAAAAFISSAELAQSRCSVTDGCGSAQWPRFSMNTLYAFWLRPSTCKHGC